MTQPKQGKHAVNHPTAGAAETDDQIVAGKPTVLSDADLDTVAGGILLHDESGTIAALKAEADVKFSNAMDAATAEMVMGMVASAAAASGATKLPPRNPSPKS